MSIKFRVAAVATALALSGAAAFVPFAAVADTTQDLINQLTAQVASLTQQLAALKSNSSSSSSTTSSNTSSCTFTRDLTIGSRGADVTCLQQALTVSGHFTYSGGATGYFGPITRAAVSAWQAANGVSPTAGYFGPRSRAKFASLVVISSTTTNTTTTTTTTKTTPPPSTTTTTTAIGTGTSLVVSTPVQPIPALAPAGASRIPATNITLTASNDGDVVVKNIRVQRQGLADDSAIDSIVLLDAAGNQIGLSKTLNANHEANLNQWFTIPKGTSQTMTIAFNRPAAGSNGGQVASFAVTAIDAGTAVVSGSLPVIGNGQTINETLTIGSLVISGRGTLDPGSSRGALEVGALKFYASGQRWTVGSAEPLLLEQVRMYQSGSAASGDLANVVVTVKGVDYPTTISADGKFYVAKFSPAIEYGKGDSLDIGTKLDVISGSGRTIDFDVQRRTDIVARGKTFGYVVIPSNGSSVPTVDTGAFSSSEPYYDAYEHTISSGTLRVEKSNSVPASNVAVSVGGTSLGAFGIEAKGEDIQVTSFKLTFGLSGTGAGTDIDNVALYDKNGAIVAGPKDVGSDRTVTFTDTWIVPVGYNVYTVKGKLTTNFANGDTVTASSTPGSDITARGQTTGLTITPTPSTLVNGNIQTVKTAALIVSVAGTPSAQNVVRGINGFLFAQLVYDASNSGEDLRVTAQKLGITPASSANANQLNNCQMLDGATVLNTGSNRVDPTAGTAEVAATFTLDNQLIVPKASTKTIDVRCNVSGNATANGTFSIGLTSTNNTTTVVGKDTGVTVTPTTTNNAGPVMTIKSGGVITVSLDPSSPSERFGTAGKTDVVMAVFKLHADNEPIKLTKFGLDLASATASTTAVNQVTLWDGATKVGSAIFQNGVFYATSTLSSDFIVPKDADKLLTVKADLIAAGTSGPLGKSGTSGADTGHLIVINTAAGYTTATEGIGQSSGTTINPSAAADPTGIKGVRLVKAYPTLAVLPLTTNTLSNTALDLYRFSVTAPTDGDIGLFKFTFRISSTSVATTSAFKVYAYTDSAFSTQAYAANPINANPVNCVGGWSIQTAAAVSTCNASTSGNGNTGFTNVAASTTNISVFFDPVTNNSSTPNAEAISVPAGTTRYFKLVGTVSRTTTGDSISVALVGDSIFFPTISTQTGLSQGSGNAGGIAQDTLAVGSSTASSSNFVWSPNSTTTSATTTNDWLNGYLLPGLPATEMSPQTLSK